MPMIKTKARKKIIREDVEADFERIRKNLDEAAFELKEGMKRIHLAQEKKELSNSLYQKLKLKEYITNFPGILRFSCAVVQVKPCIVSNFSAF